MYEAGDRVIYIGTDTRRNGQPGTVVMTYTSLITIRFDNPGIGWEMGGILGHWNCSASQLMIADRSHYEMD